MKRQKERELRILMLEDLEDDAALAEQELKRGGLPFSMKRVWTREAFLHELEKPYPDLIISDYTLPSYDGLSALADARERCLDVPFIFLSGTMGEEFAIETMKRGATDYVLKDRLSRLLPAVTRSLREAEEHRERRRAEEELRESRRNLSRAQEIARIGSWSWDIVNDRLAWSDETYRIFGLTPHEFGSTYEAFLRSVHPEDRSLVKGAVEELLEGKKPYDIDHRIVLPDGSLKVIHGQAQVAFDDCGKPVGIEGIVHDITERKQAEEKLQKQLEHMTALRDIGIAVSSSLDLRVTLDILLERLVTQLGVDAADVLLLDQNTLYLNYSASRGFRNPAIQGTRVRLGKGHAGRAAFERRTLIIRNLADTLTYALGGEGFEAYIAVPLIAQGKVGGVLEIFHRKPLNPSFEWLNFLELIAGQAAIAIDNAAMFDSLQRFNVELTLAYDATLEGWGRTLEFRDESTRGHTERVTEMTLRLARLMGLEERDLVHARRGALLHDIGKIGIPDSILLKPGPLTEEETAIMQRHPVYAHELLSAIPFLRPSVEIPYCHHEKWDGSGYPRGLRGEEIPFKVRMFSVVDVADALVSGRPYRSAWSEEKARQYIESQKGIHFDPSVVEAFLGMKWECRLQE